MTEQHDRQAEPSTPPKRRRGPFCSNCGYDLSATFAGDKCPECGLDVALMIAPVPKKTSSWATASLIMGVASFFVFFTAPLAIYFAVLARRDVAAGKADHSSKTLANAGQVCGIVAIVLFGLAMLFQLVF